MRIVTGKGSISLVFDNKVELIRNYIDFVNKVYLIPNEDNFTGNIQISYMNGMPKKIKIEQFSDLKK